MDSEYEFDHCSASEDEHENEAMETLIKNDELEDSGYGDKLSKPGGKNNDDDIVGADALLELANKACVMKPLSVSSDASDSTWLVSTNRGKNSSQENDWLIMNQW